MCNTEPFFPLTVYVFMFIYLPVPVFKSRWPHLRYCAALSKFVQFVEDRVRLLECSPASCQALRNQREEKREKFITNCFPLVLTHAGTVSNFEKNGKSIFFYE